MRTRVQGELKEQESRESCDNKGPVRVVRTKVQEYLREQASTQSCENKGPGTVVRTGSSNSCEKKSPGEQGYRKRGKIGSGKVVRTRVQAVENNSYEKKTAQLVCPAPLGTNDKHNFSKYPVER